MRRVDSEDATGETPGCHRGNPGMPPGKPRDATGETPGLSKKWTHFIR